MSKIVISKIKVYLISLLYLYITARIKATKVDAFRTFILMSNLRIFKLI